jgi:hypothetical protein
MKITNTANWREDLFNRWPQEWPDKTKHVIPHDVTLAQYEELVALLQVKAGERDRGIPVSQPRSSLDGDLDVPDGASHELDFSKATVQALNRRSRRPDTRLSAGWR